MNLRGMMKGRLGQMGMGLLLCLATATGLSQTRPQTWGNPARPGTYWWWMGSAVDTANLRWNLEGLRDAGVGGVLVIPIYGVKGYEGRFVDFLSPKWMRLFAYTVEEASHLGLWVDMTTGTGWPFGGRHVRPEDAAKRLAWRWLDVPAGAAVDTCIRTPHLQAVVLWEGSGKGMDLTPNLRPDRRLRLGAAPRNRRLLVTWWEPTGQHVKRAAPGNQGLVLDPFSAEALHAYVFRFDTAFTSSGAPWPRAQYHDSFEYYRANWTNHFLEAFRSRRGYNLAPFLPLLLGMGPADSVARVKHDYRQTLSELHLDYIRSWVSWAHRHGCLTRNQAHGAPGNLLDLYAAADIPETEAFGSASYPIPGFRREHQNVGLDVPDPLVFRFASSAAHVAGKRLVSSETCTWLREHFKAALSQAKPEIDDLFCAGINHISYHGNAYSPADAPWPGWLFYASVAFQRANAIWHDFPALNTYVEHCQALLQQGQPDNDLLFYWPVNDIWQDTTGLQRQLTVHDRWWIDTFPYGSVASRLLDIGVAFDFVTDSQLAGLQVEDSKLRAGTTQYRALLVPTCRTFPLESWQMLLRLTRQGATILLQRPVLRDVPGLLNYKQRRHLLRRSQEKLRAQMTRREPEIQEVRLGKGHLLFSEDAPALLDAAGIVPEQVARHGIRFVRRRRPHETIYFLANLSSSALDGWVELSRPFKAATIVDPLTGAQGQASVRTKGLRNEVYLQLKPGQSCLLRVFQADADTGQPWIYTEPAGQAVALDGNWRVTFIEGGPTLPRSVSLRVLRSWTELDDPESQRFAGTARYTTSFRLPNKEADDWLLDLGDVRESARVRVNGHDVGVLWSLPYQTRIGKFVHPGWNTLELEVTSLAANRVRDLDRRGIPWKQFYDINFVNIRYEPFDASKWKPVLSGLLGPVRLVPLRKVKPR